MKGGTLDLREYLLQWGRPFYGAERHFFSDTGSTENSFNGAALFTGRREGPIVWTCQRSGQLQWGRPFYGAESLPLTPADNKDSVYLLQWGRPFYGAESWYDSSSSDPDLYKLQWGRPFYGAESFGLFLHPTPPCTASMGPPFLRGGETSSSEGNQGRGLLQWGRPFYGAERGTRTPHLRPIIHWASMGPPFLRGGEDVCDALGVPVHLVEDLSVPLASMGPPFLRGGEKKGQK